MPEVIEVTVDRRDLRSESIDKIKQLFSIKSFFDLASVPRKIRVLPFTAIIAAIAFFFGSASTFSTTLWVLLVINCLGVAVFVVAAIIYRKHRTYIADALNNAKITRSVSSGQKMTLKFDGIQEDRTPILVVKQVVELAERIKKDPVKVAADFNTASKTLVLVSLVALLAFLAPALSTGALGLMAALVALQMVYLPAAYIFQKNFLDAVEYLESILHGINDEYELQAQELNS